MQLSGTNGGRARLNPTPIEWLCLAVGVVLTLRYGWLLDDAFVYFRYVDNLVLLGNGLVYNPGEYVEGYTSPAWMLLLVGLRLLGLDLWHAVLGVGCAASAAFWWLLCKLDRAMGGESRLNVPLIYLSANYAVNTYFTSGMSMPLVQLWAVVFALYLLEPGSRGRQVAIGMAPFVRQELALPLLLAMAWTWWRRGLFPKWALGAAVLTAGGWQCFRIVYYADLFPNTYYLKSTPLGGLRWSRRAGSTSWRPCGPTASCGSDCWRAPGCSS